MGRPINDITGKVFGRLKVLRISRRKPMGTRSVYIYWFCLCECGKTKEILASNLVKATGTRSCGCLQDEQRRQGFKRHKKDSAFRLCLSDYKTGARKRGLSWELTDVQFKEITSSVCHYTGFTPTRFYIAKSGEKYFYNGIDRKDNTKGYTLDNCLPCCMEVNFMKRGYTYEEFIKLCKVISERIQI